MWQLPAGAVVIIVLILAVTLCSVVSSLSTAWSARARYRAEFLAARERRFAVEAESRYGKRSQDPTTSITPTNDDERTTP
jgi:hypothetical protein